MRTDVVAEESAVTVTIDTATDRFVVPLALGEQQHNTRVSPMPKGLLNDPSDDDVRDVHALLPAPQPAVTG